MLNRLNGQSLEKQYNYGIKTLKDIGVDL